MDIFDTLVAKISAANEIFEASHPSTHYAFYLKEKVPENSKIYHNSFNEIKSKRISERELRRPWSKLSINYKIMVVLDFLKEYEQQHPGINLNTVRFETMRNIDQNKGADLKTDYDYHAGKLRKIFGYKLTENGIQKADTDSYIGNKVSIGLRFKSSDSVRQEIEQHNEMLQKISDELAVPKKIVGNTAFTNKR